VGLVCVAGSKNTVSKQLFLSKKQVNHLSKKDPTLPVVQLLDGWTVELFGSHKDCFF
jgi:hypothetical protein